MSVPENEKDPFEDIFRDKLFDFESSMDDNLWKKIEPQLPVQTGRKFPYWQMSTVIALLLFIGIGVYKVNWQKSEYNKLTQANQPLLTKDEKDILPKNESNQITNITIPQNSKSVEITTITPKESLLKEGKTAENVVNKTTEYNNTTYEKAKLSPKKSSIAEEIAIKKSIKKQRSSSKNVIENDEIQVEIGIHNQLIDSRGNKPNRNSVFTSNTNEIGSNELIANAIQEEKATLPLSFSSLASKDYQPFLNHFRIPKLKYKGPKPTVYFKEKKPVAFYMSAMPLLNYYTITPNNDDANYVHNISVNDDADRVGFYTQAGVMFTLSDRLKLRTGLTFTKTNHSFSYRVRTDSLVVQSPDNTGVDVSFAEINKVYSQAANYLGTKIELQYTFLRGEGLTHYVNIGMEGSYRLNGENQFNSFVNLAYGVTRQIGDNAYVFIEPTYSYSLNQQSDSNALLLIKPNKIGFNIGINFKLR